MPWLEGTTAVVTGAASGIGRAVATRFLDEGAQVVAFDRSADRLDQLAKDTDGRIVGVAGDVTRYADNQRAVQQAVASFGKLDIFVGNAGLWDFSSSLADTDPEKLSQAFDELMGVNLKGYLLGAKAALPELQKSGGNMIFTVSNAGFWPGGGGPVYTASKHAAVGLIRQLALELMPIRVNGVAPGGTATDLRGLAALEQDGVSFSSLVAQIRERNPDMAGMMAAPEEHAGAYVFLASNQNSPRTTGTVLDSTGGMLPGLIKTAMRSLSGNGN